MKILPTLFIGVFILATPIIVHSQGACAHECVCYCYEAFNRDTNEMMSDFFSDVEGCGGFLEDPSFYKNMAETYKNKDPEALLDVSQEMLDALECIEEASSDKDRQLNQFGEQFDLCMTGCGC